MLSHDLHPPTIICLRRRPRRRRPSVLCKHCLKHPHDTTHNICAVLYFLRFCVCVDRAVVPQQIKPSSTSLTSPQLINKKMCSLLQYLQKRAIKTEE